MQLTKALEDLAESFSDGRTSATDMQARLRSLIYHDLPDAPPAALAEMRRLRQESALNQVDREFAAEREACMIRQYLTRHEPTEGRFWSLLAGSAACLGLTIYGGHLLKQSAYGPLWIFMAFLTLVMLGTFCKAILEHYRKMKRLNRARTARDLSRRMLEKMQSAP